MFRQPYPVHFGVSGHGCAKSIPPEQVKVPRLYNVLIGKQRLCCTIAPVRFQRVTDWSTKSIILQVELHWIKRNIVRDNGTTSNCRHERITRCSSSCPSFPRHGLWPIPMLWVPCWSHLGTWSTKLDQLAFVSLKATWEENCHEMRDHPTVVTVQYQWKSSREVQRPAVARIISFKVVSTYCTKKDSFLLQELHRNKFVRDHPRSLPPRAVVYPWNIIFYSTMFSPAINYLHSSDRKVHSVPMRSAP